MQLSDRFSMPVEFFIFLDLVLLDLSLLCAAVHACNMLFISSTDAIYLILKLCHKGRYITATLSAISWQCPAQYEVTINVFICAKYFVSHCIVSCHNLWPPVITLASICKYTIRSISCLPQKDGCSKRCPSFILWFRTWQVLYYDSEHGTYILCGVKFRSFWRVFISAIATRCWRHMSHTWCTRRVFWVD